MASPAKWWLKCRYNFVAFTWYISQHIWQCWRVQEHDCSSIKITQCTFALHNARYIPLGQVHFTVICPEAIYWMKQYKFVTTKNDPGGGGTHLYLKLAIILVKKIMLLGLLFRTRQCTRVHSLGVQNVQNWKKRVCFGHSGKFWKGHGGQIKKDACQNAYLGSISYLKNTCLGCVLKVFLRGWYPAWNYKCTPPPPPPEKWLWFVNNMYMYNIKQKYRRLNDGCAR